MPAPTATGPISVPKRKLCEMLAEAETWQTWCGLAYPDAAAADKLIDGIGGTKRIYFPTADANDLGELYDRMPLAVVGNGTSWTMPTKAGGAGNYMRPNGQLSLIVADIDRYPDNLESSQREFENRLGDLMEDLRNLSGRSDRLAMDLIAQQIAPSLPPEDEQNARPDRTWWAAMYLIDWK
jgi:hypothetical protein